MTVAEPGDEKQQICVAAGGGGGNAAMPPPGPVKLVLKKIATKGGRIDLSCFLSLPGRWIRYWMTSGLVWDGSSHLHFSLLDRKPYSTRCYGFRSCVKSDGDLHEGGTSSGGLRLQVS